jgi:pyruvate formate lyase activating enzyme
MTTLRRTTEPSGTVFNIQRFSTKDGPGVRTTVFLKGCPLACSWCHNPESRDAAPQLAHRLERCILCGECSEACPRGAISFSSSRMVKVMDLCEQCMTCVEACGADAWAGFGSTMTAGEVMREVVRDAPFYEESGGGVTFSGGEPLMQPDFLAALLAAARLAGLHTAVDTCGAADPALFQRIMPLTDLFLYDLKVMDDRRHHEEVGGTNRLILENLECLAKDGAQVMVRLPVIPGITDDEENVARWGAFIAGLHQRPKVQLLPYHRTGEAKYSLLGMDGKERAVISTPAKERLEEIAGALATFGLEATIGAQWK